MFFKRLKKIKKKKIGFTKSILVINFVFIISQLINGLRRIMSFFWPLTDLLACKNSFSYIFKTSVAFLSVNASINFVVFIFFNTIFKKDVKKLWILITKKKNKVNIQKSNSLETDCWIIQNFTLYEHFLFSNFLATIFFFTLILIFKMFFEKIFGTPNYGIPVVHLIRWINWINKKTVSVIREIVILLFI